MAITVAEVAKNVCMSRHWKSNHVGFRTRGQTPASFTLLVAQRPDRPPVCPVYPEFDQHRNLTLRVCNDQTLCVEIGRMSNRREAEFVCSIFCMQSFWEVEKSSDQFLSLIVMSQ
jgi:hypothetical protein